MTSVRPKNLRRERLICRKGNSLNKIGKLKIKLLMIFKYAVFRQYSVVSNGNRHAILFRVADAVVRI